MFALLESVRNLLQNSFDTTRLTLGMLLHYLGKLKIQIFCKYATTRLTFNQTQTTHENVSSDLSAPITLTLTLTRKP